jgi:hypothetical protein
MIQKYLIIILGFLTNGLFAQNYVDIARLYYNNTTQNKFENSIAQTRVTEFGIDINYPILLKSGNAFLTGLSAETTQLRLGESEGYTYISSFTLRVGVNIKHSEKWSGTYLFAPKMASDFKQTSSKNFQFGALALMRFNKTDRMNYKIGLFYNAELFGPFITPILGLYYLTENGKFEANLALPSSVDLNYKLAKPVTAGLNFTGQIKSYRLSSAASTCNAGYVRKSTNEICGYLKFNFSKSLSLQTRVGYTIGRAYRVYSENDKIDLGISFIKIGDNRTQLNTNFANGMIYQAILLYRFARE